MPQLALNIIVAALLRRADQVLLVQQQGPGDPEASWMLPGGRVEQGETLLAALAREVHEETGLRLVGRRRIAFAVELVTDGGRYSALTFECHAEGSLAPSDPDGFVLAAEWTERAEALARLDCVAWYDCIPLDRFLSGEAPAGTVYLAGEA